MGKGKSKVVRSAEKLVETAMAGRDASHDAAHAFRVRDLALSLASEEGLGSDPTSDSDSLEIMDFNGLDLSFEADLIDFGVKLTKHLGDYKYMKNSVEDTSVVERFLDEEGLQESKREKILSIIKGMGFKNEVSQTAPIKFPTEFGVVQDADRLDAIGAIGIARCFTYGGSVNQILHDPSIPPRQNLSKEKYMNKDEKQTTINHFHEKLFRLKDLMKTEAGKRRAEKRHKFMQDFLKEFYEEWEGKA